jgi:hypothetical protein
MSDTRTKLVIAEMLAENTGTHLLDSGGAYGRHWQQHRSALTEEVDIVDYFEGRPRATLCHKYGVCVTLDVYHWLVDRLEFDEEMQRQFEAFSMDPLRLEEMQNFAIDQRQGKGIYGDDGGALVVNTYNGEDLLSQTIQYVYWTEGESWNREAYILLQIHGGCDVRGGYTAPKAFRLSCYEGVSIFDNARATIFCTGEDCEAYWDTENGYSFHADGNYCSDDLELDGEADFPTCPECGGRLEADFHAAG